MYNSLLAIAKLKYIHGAAVAKTGYSSIPAFATRHNSLLSIAKLRYIHGAAVAKTGYSYISAFATRPGRHLIGWVDRL